MKKTMTWIALGVVGALTLAGFAVAPASAQESEDETGAPDDRAGRGPRFGGLRLIRALGLTDEQIEQARALREAARDESSGVREQVRAEVQALVPRIKNGSLSQNDLVSAHRRIHDLMGKVGEQRAETMYKLYQILTPEQREKLGDLIERRLENGRGFGFGFGFGMLDEDDHGRGRGRRGRGGETGPRGADGADDSGPQSARPAPRGGRGEHRAAGAPSAPLAR